MGFLAALQDGQIVAPADFSHQWCEFYVREDRLWLRTRLSKVSVAKTAPA